MHTPIRCCLAALSLAILTVSGSPADEPGVETGGERVSEPIVALSLRPNDKAFMKSTAMKPLELKSAKAAADYFDEKSLATLTEKVDFEKQVVLVFAWRGSGQDKLTYAVAESFPEQIQYTYQRGLTRDLRPHTHVHVLRSNVKWQVKGGRRAFPGLRPVKPLPLKPKTEKKTP